MNNIMKNMKITSKIAALLMLPLAAGAANFPVGTHLIKGTLKDCRTMC